jgi:hypothetical protein
VEAAFVVHNNAVVVVLWMTMNVTTTTDWTTWQPVSAGIPGLSSRAHFELESFNGALYLAGGVVSAAGGVAVACALAGGRVAHHRNAVCACTCVKGLGAAQNSRGVLGQWCAL